MGSSVSTRRRTRVTPTIKNSPIVEKSSQQQPVNDDVELDALHITVKELCRDMSRLSRATNVSFGAELEAVLHQRSAPMLLLNAEELRKLGRVPRFDEVESLLTPFKSVRFGIDRIIFISHRWFKPHQPDGDANEKVKIVMDIVDQHVKSSESRIFIWWDFYSICQENVHNMVHNAKKSSQILAIPFYLGAADTIIALRGGDIDSYSTENITNKTYLGQYDNRVWTKLELFGFTSSFAERMHGLRLGEKGQPRYAFDVELGFEDSKLTQKAIKHGTTSGFNTPITYEHFHDTPGAPFFGLDRALETTWAVPRRAVGPSEVGRAVRMWSDLRNAQLRVNRERHHHPRAKRSAGAAD